MGSSTILPIKVSHLPDLLFSLAIADCLYAAPLASPLSWKPGKMWLILSLLPEFLSPIFLPTDEKQPIALVGGKDLANVGPHMGAMLD